MPGLASRALLVRESRAGGNRVLLLAALLLVLAAVVPARDAAAQFNPACTGASQPESWPRRFVDASTNCSGDTNGGKDGADGVDAGDIDRDGDFDIVTGWEESGEVAVALNPGPGSVHSVAQWPTLVLAGDKKGLEDAIFVDNDGDGLLDYVASAAEGDVREVFVHTASINSVSKDLPGDGKFYMRVRSGDIFGDDGCDDLIVGAKDNKTDGGIFVDSGIWVYECPDENGDWNPGDSVSGWSRHKIAGDTSWIMELEVVDMDADGDLDVLYTDREQLGWMKNPLANGEGNPRDGADWKKVVIENAGGNTTGVEDPYRWSHFVDFFDNGTDANGQPFKELIVATNYDFERGVVARWYERYGTSGVWIPHEVIVDHDPVQVNPGIPFLADKHKSQVSKAVRVADLDGDGRVELVLTARGGEFDPSKTIIPNKGVGVYRLSLPGGVSEPVPCGLDCDEPGEWWVYSPIAESFSTMKYDNIALVDFDGDGDLDVATVEENVDGKGLGTIWYENRLVKAVRDDFAVPRSGVTSVLPVTDNDLGADLDPCTLSIVQAAYPGAVSPSATCGSVDFVPDLNRSAHLFFFIYRVCAEGGSPCSDAYASIEVEEAGILQNPGFELPVLASSASPYGVGSTALQWSISGTSVLLTRDDFREPAEGSQSLELGPAGGATISQGLALDPALLNVIHAVRFSEAADPGPPSSGLASIQASAAGATTRFDFDEPTASPFDMKWADRALWFDPGGAAPTLSFAATAGEPVIDDVRVVPMEEVASITTSKISFSRLTNEVLSVDLSSYVSLTPPLEVDFSSSRVLFAPPGLCGRVEKLSPSEFRFVPSAASQNLARPRPPPDPPRLCEVVEFVIEVEILPGWPAQFRFEVDLTPSAGFTPVAVDDTFTVEYEDIDEAGESFVIAPLANDSDADCPLPEICYGTPQITSTTPNDLSCAVISNPRGPEELRCSDYTGSAPPTNGMNVVTIDYELVDAWGVPLPSPDRDAATITIQITPRPPSILVSHEDFDFGQVATGEPHTIVGTITNDPASGTDLYVSSIVYEGQGGLSVPVIPQFGPPFTLAPGQSNPFLVRAERASTGVRAGTVTISSTDPDGPVNIPVYAEFVDPPDLQLSTSSLDFGSVLVGGSAELPVTISNVAAAGSAALEITSLGLSGNGHGTFARTSPNATLGNPIVVQPGGSTVVTIQAAPASEALLTASLDVQSNDSTSGNPSIPLEVTGVVAGDVEASPGVVQFGFIDENAVAQRTTRLENVHPTGVLEITDIRLEQNAIFSLVSPPALPLSLAPGAFVDVTLEAAPAGATAEFESFLVVEANGPQGDLQVPVQATTLPITRVTHFSDADPLLEDWALDPADTGTGTEALAADPDFPGVAAFGVQDLDAARTYEVPGPATGQPWTLRARLRAATLDDAVNDNSVHVLVADGASRWRVRVGTSATGDTILGIGTQLVVPPTQPGRTDYVLIEMVRDASGVDLFVNGVELWSDWAGGSTGESRVTFGDGRGTPRAILDVGRYELIEYVPGGVAACSDGIDDDGDGLTDFAGGDPDCSQPNDPSEDRADHDDDGLLDGFELANGLDPTDPDEDGDGLVDGQDDFDADGLANAAEALAGTDPNDDDSDDDGLLDGAELAHTGFGGQQIISTQANGAQSVIAVDIDGDGDLDVLSASHNDDEIRLYRNDGSGAFPVDELVTAGADAAREVAAADVDGDGLVDVLSASKNDGTIAWYRNLGAGWSAANVITSVADSVEEVAVADIDGDGDADVMASSALQDSVAWYENVDGAGSFGPAKDFGTASLLFGLILADLDGDGDLDALSASESDDKIDWWRNEDGAGSFAPRADISNTADGARDVVAVDVDGDGDRDVASVSLTDSKLAWYENTDGAGTFGAEQVVAGTPVGLLSIFAADVDGDGDPDLLTTSNSSGVDTVAWYENSDGLGSFAAPVFITTLVKGPRAVVAADLDGDGDLDAVSASNGDDKVAWYENLTVADPLDPDSDDDGLLDGFEVAHGFDPLVPGEEGLDPDDDGLDNLAEQAAGTDPNAADSDGDGWSDPDEIAAGTDPLDDQSFPIPVVPALPPWGAPFLLVLLVGGARGTAGRKGSAPPQPRRR